MSDSDTNSHTDTGSVTEAESEVCVCQELVLSS